MNTEYSETQKIMFEIEQVSLALAKKFDSTKPLYIVLNTSLYDIFCSEKFIETNHLGKSTLNGRYQVIVSDIPKDKWYLMFNNTHLTKQEF